MHFMIFNQRLKPILHFMLTELFNQTAGTQKYHRLKETFDYNLETYRDREKSLK